MAFIDSLIEKKQVLNRFQDCDDTRPLVHFQVGDADQRCDAENGDAVTSNGRLADREAAEMLKKKKPKRDSNLTLRIDVRSPSSTNEPTTTTTMTDDNDTISDAVVDNKFLETSL